MTSMMFLKNFRIWYLLIAFPCLFCMEEENRSKKCTQLKTFSRQNPIVNVPIEEIGVKQDVFENTTNLGDSINLGDSLVNTSTKGSLCLGDSLVDTAGFLNLEESLMLDNSNDNNLGQSLNNQSTCINMYGENSDRFEAACRHDRHRESSLSEQEQSFNDCFDLSNYQIEDSGKWHHKTSTPIKRRRTFNIQSDSMDSENVSNEENETTNNSFQSSSFELNGPISPAFDGEFNFQTQSTLLNNDDESRTMEQSLDNDDYHFVKAHFAAPSIQCSSEDKGNPGKSRLLSKHTRVICIQEDFKRFKKCCYRQCLFKFSIRDAKNMRLQFWSKTANGRTQWLLNKFSDTSKNAPINFRIQDGNTVCSKALIGLFGISKNFYYNTRKKYLKGARFCLNDRYRSLSLKMILAINWLEDYATFYADRMPDSNVKLLPYRTRQCSIYLRYKEDKSEINDPILMPSAFYKMWKKHFPFLKIKQTNSFSKCTTCTSLERQIETTHDPILKEKLRKERAEHNKMQMMERKYYYNKRNEAKTSPSHFLSLIIDGMDQSKTNLPHLVGRMAKAMNPVDKLATHVTGVLAHGQNKFFTFLDWNQYAHDSNLTMNIILLILFEISKTMNNKLPPVLYLQADNCWRENKNRYMLALCQLLIHMKIFNEVHLSFLPVGHTHEDIDAAFSKIAERLRRNDAETLPRLKGLLQNNKEIEALYDIRSWLTPYINEIRKHTLPLHYKFSKDSVTNKVKMEYKALESSNWKLDANGMLNPNNLPKGIPKILHPSFDKLNLERMKTKLPQWQCLFTDQVEHTERKWWSYFLEHLLKIKNDINYRKRHVLSKAKWILPQLPKQIINSSPERSSHDIPPEIRRLLEREREDCTIEVRPRNIRQKKGNPQKRQNKEKKAQTKAKKRSDRHQQPSRRKIVASYVYGYLIDSRWKKHYLYLMFWYILQTLFLYNILCQYIFYIYCLNHKAFLAIWNENIHFHTSFALTKHVLTATSCYN